MALTAQTATHYAQTHAAATATHAATATPHPAVPPDSVAMDSVVADSVAAPRYGIVIEVPAERQTAPAATRSEGSADRSWILTGLLLLFVAVCLRMRSNSRYLKAMVTDLTDVRERHNAFDDTVKETSMLVMLNLLWCLCAGVMIYTLLCYAFAPGMAPPQWSLGLQALQNHQLSCTGICAGVGTLYTLGLLLAYTTVGNVFSDSLHAGMWVKGFLASQGLSAVILLPLAVMAVCLPEWWPQLLIAAAVTFAAGKIIFICKGFRIFFNQTSSWILFLYYLCSLEIVPLIIVFVTATELCSLL